MFHVYILRNAKGQFYVGHTDNVSARLLSHNRTDDVGTKFTRKNGPWSLVWSEPHLTRSSAMARARQIKRMKSSAWIERELLNGKVPTSRI